MKKETIGLPEKIETKSETKITAASALIKCLEAEGITAVFGYPGAAICPFYDELHNSNIEHILVRHEANAGHAASGYARVSGKPAVCVATSGPGATNLITAIATAYMDSIPMIIITGQVNSDQIGRDVFQEADITGAAEPFVKHSYLVKDAESLPETVKKAFYIAGSGRPGPVLIDIPADVLTEKINFSYSETVEIRSYKPQTEGNKPQIKRVAEALSEAERPLICAGGGIFTGKGPQHLKILLKTLAESHNIPVISTMMGISALPSRHKLYFGMLGTHGRKTPNRAIRECDVLLLLGARVGDRAVTAINKLKDIKVIHIDIDPAEIGKNLPVSIPVVGELSAVLNRLLEQLKDGVSNQNSKENWVKYLSDRKADEEAELTEAANAAERRPDCVNPKEFYNVLNRNLPVNSIVAADVGQNQIWTANNLELRDGGRFLTSGGMGTMGYSVPAAVGAKKAAPKSETLAICGDGSFQMQFMELATMVQHNIPVKIIVMRNNRLGMVRELQAKAYGNRLSGVFLDGSPDFIKLAEAYGIKGEKVSDITEAETAVKNLFSSEAPYILEVRVDEEEKSLI